MSPQNKFTIQKPKVSVSQNPETKRKNFVITKKIAKHGRQAVIIIPSLLQDRLKAGDIVKLEIEILE